VFDQDPQRVCILQGPVAVKHAVLKDEPIKDLLGNITSQLAHKLLDRLYDGDESKVPVVDYLGTKPAPLPETFAAIPGVDRDIKEKQISYTVGESLPETSLWLEILAGPRLSWLRALLTSPTIVQGTAYIDSPLRRLFAPRKGQRVVIVTENDLPIAISLYGAARSHGEHKPDFKAVEVKYAADSHRIYLTLFEDRRDASVPLQLEFEYKPFQGFAPIHEIASDRNKRIKEFYWKLWFGDDEVLPEIDVRAAYTGPEVTIDATHIEAFCSVVGNQNESFKSARTKDVQAPMDFAIVTGWQVSSTTMYTVELDLELFFSF
jgi:fatty acid synthase subunit alpha, fungi type